MITVFFFSSRRRHTRLVSDWSSDVCSSDLSQAVAGRGGGNEFGVDTLTAKRGFDECLALLDLARAGFGGCGKAGEVARGGRAGEKLGSHEAGPGDKAEEDNEEQSLDGRGNTETAQPRSVMNEEVAVAKQRCRRRKYLGHRIPAPKLARRAMLRGVTKSHQSGAPQPLA